MTDVSPQTDDFEDAVGVPQMRKGTVSYSLGDSKRMTVARPVSGTPGLHSMVHSQSSNPQSRNVNLEMVTPRMGATPHATREGAGDVDVGLMLAAMQHQLAELSSIF